MGSRRILGSLGGIAFRGTVTRVSSISSLLFCRKASPASDADFRAALLSTSTLVFHACSCPIYPPDFSAHGAQPQRIAMTLMFDIWLVPRCCA